MLMGKPLVESVFLLFIKIENECQILKRPFQMLRAGIERHFNRYHTSWDK